MAGSIFRKLEFTRQEKLQTKLSDFRKFVALHDVPVQRGFRIAIEVSGKNMYCGENHGSGVDICRD